MANGYSSAPAEGLGRGFGLTIAQGAEGSWKKKELAVGAPPGVEGTVRMAVERAERPVNALRTSVRSVYCPGGRKRVP